MRTFPRLLVVDVARIVAVGGFACLVAGGLGCGGGESPGASGKGGASATGTGGTTATAGTGGSSGVAGGAGSSSTGSAGIGSGGTTGGTTGSGGTAGAGTGGGTAGASAGGGAAGTSASGSGGGGRGGSSGGGAGAGRGGGGGAGTAGSGGAGAGGAAGRGGSGAVAGGGGGAGRGGATGTGGATGGGGAAGSASASGPPMGWASWNTFAAKINYNVIKQQADAMVSSGLKAAGYQYVNIDEGWWQGTRDASGNITVDTSEWPGGMQAIADYIHGLGLKAGIYTDAGKQGCGYYYPTGRPAAPNSGAEGHYDQDFLQFSKWGFDFVKVDWCGGNDEGLNPQTAYTAISDSIKKATAQTGRPMVFSVCDWGNQSPWNWAPNISTMWRTSQDIIYYGEQANLDRVLSNFDSAQHASAQSPGHYNDPDMLIVGMPSFTLAQNRTHMALWAIASAPLLAGNNLMTMSSDTKGVLTNSEVIAINQDSLAKQGAKLSGGGTGLEIYNKTLSGTGRRAVLLLNRSGATATMTVRFADIGLGSTAAVRNVWAAMDVGTKTTSYDVSVPAHDSVLLLVTQAP
jgi:hypothetical protein